MDQCSPAERLARTFHRYYVEEQSLRGVDDDDWGAIDSTGRAAMIAACERLLVDKATNDEAWFRWNMAGNDPYEKHPDPEAPPMPTHHWP